MKYEELIVRYPVREGASDPTFVSATILQELVRCKDCKYHEPYTKHGYVRCEEDWLEKPENWFCADGKRGEDDRM